MIPAFGLEPVHVRPLRATEAGGGRDDGIQHRLQLGGRAADDAQDLAGCGLPLEGFADLLRPLLDLPIEAAQLLRGAVDVGGERAQLVAVPDRDPSAELAGRDLAQLPRDPPERLDDRPREHVAEAERQDDAAEREADDDEPRDVVGALARLDVFEHVGFGDVDQLVGQALEAVGERACLAQLQRARRLDLPGSGALHRPGHDRDEAVVVRADARQQIDLVLGHMFQPVEVVAELAELAQDAVELAIVLRQERRRDAVQLARGVVLHLPVGGDLALQLDQLVGAGVDTAQHLHADRAQEDDQRDHAEERDQQLGLDPRRDARDQTDGEIPERRQGSFRRSRRS